MKFIVEINSKTDPEMNVWSSEQLNTIIDLINPVLGTTVVLSKEAAIILRNFIEMIEELNILILNEDQYKYVINSDLEGVIIEFEDEFGYIRTLRLDVPEVITNFD